MEIENIKKTYQGKRVLLTGHTGFKGSWLLQWLHILGADIMGFALVPAGKEDLYNLIEGDQLCQSVTEDIRNKEAVKNVVLSFEPDFIFHLAAQPLVRLSYDAPAETFDINAMGTAHVMDALRFYQKPCVAVMITTDKVYENKEIDYPYVETDSLGGYDPYSASKACAELIIQSYTQSYFNPAKLATHQKAIASTRAGNVIGGGDWAKDRIVPDIVRALQLEQPVSVRNPRAVRPWQHVLEPLGGYLLLGERLAMDPARFTGAWNFGPLPGDNKEVEALVQEALNIWGSGTYQKENLQNQPHEATLLKLDISKAIDQLNWMPKLNAAQAIANTIEWYKQYFSDKSKIKDFTIQQIQAYCSAEVVTETESL